MSDDGFAYPGDRQRIIASNERLNNEVRVLNDEIISLRAKLSLRAAEQKCPACGETSVNLTAVDIVRERDQLKRELSKLVEDTGKEHERLVKLQEKLLDKVDQLTAHIGILKNAAQVPR